MKIEVQVNLLLELGCNLGPLFFLEMDLQIRFGALNLQAIAGVAITQCNKQGYFCHCFSIHTIFLSTTARIPFVRVRCGFVLDF
jgi:hypothetical protein